MSEHRGFGYSVHFLLSDCGLVLATAVTPTGVSEDSGDLLPGGRLVDDRRADRVRDTASNNHDNDDRAGCGGCGSEVS